MELMRLMKKIIALTASLFLLFTFYESACAMADSADCACIINGITGDIVFSKNHEKRHAMASTTKIMTAAIALEKCKMDEVVEEQDFYRSKGRR